MNTILRGLRAFVASPIFLELVRQLLRWIGVLLMTVGVPESIARLTTHEDAVMALIGAAMYATAETGWLATKWNQFKAWLKARRKAGR